MRHGWIIPLGTFASFIIVTLLIVSSNNNGSVSKPEGLTQASVEVKDLEMTVASTPEKVAGTRSLWVFEAHRGVDRAGLNHLVFFDAGGCSPEISFHLPNKGWKVKVIFVRFKASDLNYITDGFNKLMLFVQQPCG